MGQKPNRSPSEHPKPTTKIGNLKWVVHLPQNGIPLVLTHSSGFVSRKWMAYLGSHLAQLGVEKP